MAMLETKADIKGSYVNRSRYVEMVCLMPGNEPGGQTLMVLHVYNKFTNTKYSWKKIHGLQKPLGVIQEVGG